MPATLERVVGWCAYQRVPVAAMRIDRPAWEAKRVAGFALAYVALAAATGLVVRRWPLPILGRGFAIDLTYVVGFKVVVLLALPVLALRRLGYGFRALSPGWPPGRAAWLGLVVAFGLGAGVNLGGAGAIGPALAALPASRAALVLAAALVLPLVAAGLPEELVYRGLLHTRLEATLGRAPALVLAALAFAAWHLPSRYLLAHDVEGHAGDLASVLVGTGLPVFVVGLVFGWLWDRQRSLPLLIALHWGMDLLPILRALLGLTS